MSSGSGPELSPATKESINKRVVVVRRVISGRYQPGMKPDSWDERIEGVDTVECEGRGVVELLSTGDQATPSPGWRLVLADDGGSSGVRWTLFGIGAS